MTWQVMLNSRYKLHFSHKTKYKNHQIIINNMKQWRTTGERRTIGKFPTFPFSIFQFVKFMEFSQWQQPTVDDDDKLQLWPTEKMLGKGVKIQRGELGKANGKKKDFQATSKANENCRKNWIFEWIFVNFEWFSWKCFSRGWEKRKIF